MGSMQVLQYTAILHATIYLGSSAERRQLKPHDTMMRSSNHSSTFAFVFAF